MATSRRIKAASRMMYQLMTRWFVRTPARIIGRRSHVPLATAKSHGRALTVIDGALYSAAMAASATLFLLPAAGADRAALRPVIPRAVARIQARLQDGVVRGAVDAGLLGDDTAHASETSTGPGYAAVIHLETAGAGESLPDAVSGVATEFGSLIDPLGSAALAGGEHVIVPGEERLMLAMAIRRLPSLRREQYAEHWETVHAELGRQVPGSQGYRQVRPEAQLSRQVAAAAGFGVDDLDGVALAYYSDEQAFFGIMGNPEIVGPLLADEQTFIDHAASGFVCGWAQLTSRT